MIELDPKVPFVRAVRGMLDGSGDVEAAADVLIAAERRHGVRIVREDACGSIAGVLVPVAAADAATPRRLTLRQFRALMAESPERGSADEHAAFHARRERFYRAGQDEDTPDAALFPFLSEVQLLLGGTDFANDHWIVYPSGALASWTQRAWGEVLANWARATGWQPAHRALWDVGGMTYANFCFYLYTMIEDYEPWCAAVLDVIRRKCERQLDEVL